MAENSLLNCQNINFSEKLGQQRLEQFQDIVDEDVLRRMFCFNFFLLGVKRENLSKALGMPLGTLRSFIRSVRLKGISAFEDRRQKHSSFLPLTENKHFETSLELDDENIFIHFGSSEQALKISRQNTLQAKIVLFTFLKNGFLSKKEVSKALDISENHVKDLSGKLNKEDAQILMDRRQGQKKDYLFQPEIKAELIQQFCANVAIGKKTSSQTLCEDLKKRCHLDLSSRSIRFHVEKLGLSKIKTTLPKLIDSLKKNFKNG